MRMFLVAAAVAARLWAQSRTSRFRAPTRTRNWRIGSSSAAKTKAGRIDVYFEGDSIVRRWGATDYPQLLENWKRRTSSAGTWPISAGVPTA